MTAKRARSNPRARGALLALACAAPCIAGCAAPRDERDRLEPINRVVQGFNGLLDGIVIKPASQLYTFFVPELFRVGVTNFLDNALYLDTVLNDLLQGKLRQGGRDAARLLVNSTAGIGGVLDVASSMGLEEHREDFGQTLAVWGVPAGSYVVVPVFGPHTLRDVPGMFFTLFASPVPYVDRPGAVASGWALYFVDRRAAVDPDFERRAREAADPYAFTREAWWQHREFLIHDGEPPAKEGELEDMLREVEELEALEELESERDE